LKKYKLPGSDEIPAELIQEEEEEELELEERIFGLIGH
jgi:hypothetical protein